MLLYDMMDNTVESAQLDNDTAATSRRLRSLYLAATINETIGINRRFSSLNQITPTTTTTATTTTTISSSNIISPTPNAIKRTTAHIKLIPNIGITNRCFVFDIVDHELQSGGPSLKLGRYSDRTAVSDRISFKSKVVSRYHAEIWLSEQDGKLYIKDSGSSSGTFVNHIRLSRANMESTIPHELVDGDLIQLGIDYKGGLEPMYRAVRIRLEVDRREWKEISKSNTFHLNAFQQLKKTTNIQECCICLYCIAPFQALFIAPCSHMYHYKCMRPLLNQNHPGFSCPICRTYSDLDASVAVEEDEMLQMLNMLNNTPGEDLDNHSLPQKMVPNEDSDQELPSLFNIVTSTNRLITSDSVAPSTQ